MTKRETRLDLIASWVGSEGFIPLDTLADRLEVSKMTVHRDLDALHDKGILRKVRGGASAQRSSQFESDLPFRSRAALDEKRAIARAAASLASEGDVVIIDDSTTSLEVIPYITGTVPITVITNFLIAMQALDGRPHTTLVGLGGEYIERYRSFLGVLCEKALSDLYADVLFLSTSSMKGHTVYHQDQRVVTVKRAMMRAAQQRVLMMDHSKIGHGALHRLSDIEEFTHIVVDDKTSDEDLDVLREAGPEIIVATASTGDA